MLIRTHQLSEAQLKDLKQLTQECELFDGGLPSIYLHLLSQRRDYESSLLFYDNNKLVGFLAAYFFYEDGCEVSLLVTPSYRRKGIAVKLVSAILALLMSKNIERIIFSSTGSFGDEWICSENFNFHSREYHMERDSFEPVLINRPRLTLTRATVESMPSLCDLDRECFHTSETTMIDRFQYLLHDEYHTLWLAYHDETLIGKAHIRSEKDEALFSDIAVFPAKQKQGYGSELLANCINLALSNGKKHLELDVETKNQTALNIYLNHGFKTTKVYDYRLITLKKLIIFLAKMK